MQDSSIGQTTGVAYRMLRCASIAPNETGDHPPIVASFPAQIDDAAALAALVEAAAVDADMSFVKFLQKIRAAAPPLVGEIGRFRAAHRPAFDWMTEHGSTLPALAAIVASRRCECPELTKGQALAGVLADSRKSSGKRKLSLASQKIEVERLRQAVRRLPATR